MKIAVIAPAWFAVPPTGYGGIEWIVSLLADGLADAGHDVTLFASGDSHTRAKLVAVFPEAPSRQIGRTFWELKHALSAFGRADEFDVINDHTGMLGATLGATTSTPVVHTVHGPLDGEPGEIYEMISRVAPEVGLISISMNQRKPKPDLNWIANCPNALDFSVYPVQAASGGLPPLPRPAQSGQRRAPCRRRRDGGRPAAQDRRQDAGAEGARVLPRASSSRISSTASNTSERSRTARRSSCFRTRVRRSFRSSGKSRSVSS